MHAFSGVQATVSASSRTVQERTGGLEAIGLMTSAESRFEADWSACIAKLIQLGRLQDDWDGEGAPRPTPELINSVAGFARKSLKRDARLPAPSRTLVTPLGGIILEWAMPHGGRLEAEFDEVGVVEWMLQEPSGATTHFVENWEPEFQESSTPYIGVENVRVA